MMSQIFISTIIFGIINARSFQNRIIGGQEIAIEDAPYQVAVYYYQYFQCGGSLLSRSFVLTASHCMIYSSSNRQYNVKIGTNRQDWYHPSGLNINVEKVFMHPKFNKLALFDYDIALLKLEEFGKLPKNVAFVKLPTAEDDIADNENVFVTGWGLTENGNNSEILRGAIVPIVNSQKCEMQYREVKELTITDRMICAGYDEGKIDACKGDSGSPLVRQSDGIQFGITSFGEECAKPGFAGVYAKVSSALDWINEITNAV